MYNDELVKLYISYLKEGLSYKQLFNMLQYDYDLFIKKEKGNIDYDITTNICSVEDAKIKFYSLKKAKEILEFPVCKVKILSVIYNNYSNEN